MTYETNQLLILRRLAELATGPLLAILHHIEVLETAIADLDGNTCTAAIYWRDAESDSPKMILVHRKGDNCPLHGEPKNDRSRIRTYVGTEPDRQTEAEANIANHARLQVLQRALRNSQYVTALDLRNS